jgi:hypothetical protein
LTGLVSLDTYVEMYLAPASTGVYGWTTVPAPLRSSDVVITDGAQSLNTDPGTPNRSTFTVKDPSGNFNRKNPVGAYYGSIGLGVLQRIGVSSVDDQCGRTVANTNWGSVGNAAGDTWTAGTSTGGSVTAGDWSVGSGFAKHSIPAANAMRWSELSKTTRLYRNVEVRTTIKVPVSNVTGAALATGVRMRVLDASNFTEANVLFNADETLSVQILERVTGTDRFFQTPTVVAGLTLGASAVDWHIRVQNESATIRVKVWKVGDPEPAGWAATASGCTVREGYVGIVDYVVTGNTNTTPLVFQHDQVQVRIPMFAGEVTDLTPSGNNLADPKTVEIRAAGILDRLLSGDTPQLSAMRRARSGAQTWRSIGAMGAQGGDSRTVTVLTSALNGTTVGDIFFLSNPTLGLRKEDTKFTITASVPSGGNTDLSFTPDAMESVITSSSQIAVYRQTALTTRPAAYYPMEDGKNSTQISSGLVGGAPMAISGATPEFQAESAFSASAPILRMNNAELVTPVPDYSDPNLLFSVNFLLSMPDTDEAATGTDLLQFYTTGTGWSYDLRYTANGNGSFQLLVFNSASTLLFDSGQIDFGLRGEPCFVSLLLKDNGGSVSYSLYTIKQNGFGTGGTGPNTVTGVTTLGKCTMLRVNPAGGYINTAMGHLTLIPDTWDQNTVYVEFVGWINQAALHRYFRLSYENSIPMRYRQDWDVVTTNLGTQKIDRLAELLKEPVRADGGILHGMRGAAEIEVITRGALTNQAAVLTLTANDCKELTVVADFTYTENKVSVTRIDGTTATVQRDTGTLSVLDPPSGIGVHDASYSLSLGSDLQTTDQANARLGRGTVDQYRVEKLTITSAGSTAITTERLLSLGPGDRVDLTGLTTMDIYDTLPQIVTGITTRLGDRFHPTVDLTCQPYEVFRTLAITGDDLARLDTADSVTGSTLTTTATGSLTVTSTSGVYLLSTDAADYPANVMISGEVVTLSGCTSETSPQTATVSVRSVNGVVKSHAVGEPINLVLPNYWEFR